MSTINTASEQQNKTITRNIGYDLIRVISIFMVVIIHSNVAFLNTQQGSFEWIIVMQFTALCYVAVPLFFMLSGALLLDCTEPISIKVLFRKRLSKQFIPFLVWSLIYTLIRIAAQKLPFSLTSFTNLFHEPAYYQFWFMYTLLALYLILPALQAIVCALSRKQVEYILILWFLFSVIFPMVERYFPSFMLSRHSDLVLCEGYVGYFILGYYLKKYHAKFPVVVALLLSLCGFILTATGSFIELYYSIIKGTPYAGYIYRAYLLPNVVLSAIGIFLFFQNKRFTTNSFSYNMLNLGSKYTIGVFYIHMLILVACEYSGLVGNSIIVLLAKIFITFVSSLLIIHIISENSILKKILLGN